jgi:predicted  nucleic acid-binding Zn-ribbon protein
MAVQPSIPGKRKCMNCGKQFMSPDKELIRRCPKCKRNEEHLPRIVKLDQVRRSSGHNLSDY